MTQTVIRADGLTKTYKLLTSKRSRLLHLVGQDRRIPELTALRDVSFRVHRGESMGLVGDNGAGKSTLLKLIAGVTSPTRGSLHVEGRLGSLLELGTGFHPEFSGRENIFFSAALAGLSHADIRDRAEEIIAFSELGDFIEQPLKTYSTGMQLRLGFALATGFEPNILIIDEALAVGDQLFQKKCTDRIKAFQKNGGTILFCSHNLAQVRALCDRAMWIESGRMVLLDGAERVVGRYQDSCRSRGRGPEENESGTPRRSLIEKVQLSGASDPNQTHFQTGERVQLEVWARFPEEALADPGIGVALVRNDRVLVYATSTNIDGVSLSHDESGLFRATFCLPDLQLLSGTYAFNVFTSDASSLQAYDHRDGVEPFTVTNSGVERGLVRIEHYWEA